jgi:hypothetical protein
MKTFLFLILLHLFSQSIYAQYLFEKKYEGCNTSSFALESDSATAKVSDNEIMRIIATSIDSKSIRKISGYLLLQILVNEDGSSCLLSLENKTNVKTKKLNLKEAIDDQLKWSPIDKKVSAIVSVKFINQSIGIKRLGFNGFTGIHELKN